MCSYYVVHEITLRNTFVICRVTSSFFYFHVFFTVNIVHYIIKIYGIVLSACLFLFCFRVHEHNRKTFVLTNSDFNYTDVRNREIFSFQNAVY